MKYNRIWYHWETPEEVWRRSIEQDFRADEYPADMDAAAEELARDDWEDQGAVGEFVFEYWEEISAREFHHRAERH